MKKIFVTVIIGALFYFSYFHDFSAKPVSFNTAQAELQRQSSSEDVCYLSVKSNANAELVKDVMNILNVYNKCTNIANPKKRLLVQFPGRYVYRPAALFAEVCSDEYAYIFTEGALECRLDHEHIRSGLHIVTKEATSG